MSDTLLRVEDLKIYYPVAGSGFGKKEFVKAVDGVTFEVKKGEVFGIVGESGCGKSTTASLLMRFCDPLSGKIYIEGKDYCSMKPEELRKHIAMVPQQVNLFSGTLREHLRP